MFSMLHSSFKAKPFFFHITSSNIPLQVRGITIKNKRHKRTVAVSSERYVSSTELSFLITRHCLPPSPHYKWPGSSLPHSNRIFHILHRCSDSKSRRRTCHTEYQSHSSSTYTALSRSCKYRESLGPCHLRYKRTLRTEKERFFYTT